MATAENTPTYFDGLKLTKRQKVFMVLLIAGTLLEQIDLYKFAFIAPVLRELWQLDMHQVGQIHSTFGLGAIFGSIAFGWLADIWGRKKSMSLALLVGGIGALFTALAPNYALLLTFRILAGFGIGGCLVIEPVILSEMVPSAHRQRFQGLLAFVAILGIPATAALAKYLLVLDPNYWRYVAAIPAIALVIFVFYAILVPESPRWLVSKNRTDEAKAVFKHMTGHELNIDPDFVCIVEKTSFAESFKVMFKNKEYIKRTVLFFFIFGFLYNAAFMITQWLPTLLTNEGMSTAVALGVQQKLTIGLPLGALLVAIFGDMGGRKYPYAIFMSVIAVATFILSRTPLTDSSATVIGTLALIIGIFYITNQGISSMYCSECYPTRVRGIIFAFFLAIMRIGTVIANTFVAPSLYEAVGFNNYFRVISLVYVVAVALIVLIGPKTAGKSLEELTTESVATDKKSA